MYTFLELFFRIWDYVAMTKAPPTVSPEAVSEANAAADAVAATRRRLESAVAAQASKKEPKKALPN